jgi:hypothetical protein
MDRLNNTEIHVLFTENASLLSGGKESKRPNTYADGKERETCASDGKKTKYMDSAITETDAETKMEDDDAFPAKIKSLYPRLGKLLLHPVTEAEDFWTLYDELCHDHGEFVNQMTNRTTLLDAFRKGTLFSLRVTETEDMYNSRDSALPIFAKGAVQTTLYMLPIMCVVDHDSPGEVVWIWSHSRARRIGLASLLVRLLGISRVFHPLPESLPFFDALGILIT